MELSKENVALGTGWGGPRCCCSATTVVDSSVWPVEEEGYVDCEALLAAGAGGGAVARSRCSFIPGLLRLSWPLLLAGNLLLPTPTLLLAVVPPVLPPEAKLATALIVRVIDS